MKKEKHKNVFAWHHWCGLVVGIFLLLMSTTGALLAFSEEMEAAADSEWLRVENPSGRFSYDASFRQVQERYPGWEIRLYGQPGLNEALVYELRKKEQSKKAFVHPQTGAILKVNEAANQQFHRRLLLLHYTLFAGTAGKITVFFIGVLFLISLITGIYVYRKSVWKVLMFKIHLQRKTRRSFHSSLHRIVGVWSLFFNGLIVVTGLLLSGQIALNALNPAPAAGKKAAAEIASIDRIFNHLKNSHPNFNIHLIRIRPGGNAVQVSGRYKDDPVYYGNYYSRFTVDGATGTVQDAQALRNQPLGKRLLSFAGPLHFGNYGGLPVKILYCVLGLTPALLSLTGFVVWRSRRRVAKKAAHKKRDAVSSLAL